MELEFLYDHNVTLALDLLKDEGLFSYPVNPEDIVNKDAKSTLRYTLQPIPEAFTEGGGWRGTPCYPLAQPTEEELPRGGKKKYLSPNSKRNPKFEELQKVLMEWINTTLLPEHIVVRSLEEDMFDGLILHHLFQKLASLQLFLGSCHL